ncbi:common plant regulatory factor 1 isoform X2 [Jatropha curcas]|uniref:common plant regulatory factor 1 isoform X2 n=1 Tax=Jatropha curcas TaxID=180498 RepID=UPI0005FB3B1F|nr:common plant regulatory factor 1 isoform X2 [Jatropha curcas]
MGNNEEGKSSKPDKSASPAPMDQTNIHVYPDWAAMQAYYGPRVALPPYYNSAMASGHAPHPYMWGPPQPMMPPYGTPYAAVYSHGGVYAHPAVPIVGTPLNVEMPTKSTGNTDRGLMKKLKGFDGLAMSIGNGNGSGNAESAEGGDRRLSLSAETEGSSDGSDGNTSGGRKRSREGTPTIAGEMRSETPASSAPSGEVNAYSDKVSGAAVTPAGFSEKSVGAVNSPRMSTALELRNPPVNGAKTNATNIPQPYAVLPSEAWIQNDRELKRERRKQSNRESARRSRLRKQAETEELAHKVESLTSENLALKSEINQLTEKSEKLKHENAALLEKLKNSKLGQAQETILNRSSEQRASAVSTENLLSRVNTSASVDRNAGEESELYERNSNSGAKLHQLLGASPRADAVAAG